jgi:hypothetical protein
MPSLSLNTLKNAVITTAMVLGVIYVIRQVKAGDDLVKKALAG